MTVVQTPYFRRSYKRLHANQIKPVNNAIRKVLSNPLCGDEKKGDLAGIRVCKIKVLDQQFLLAYEHNKQSLFLLALGVHENFYRDLKK
jgi:mRNA interferase RelE/StbE